MSRANKHNKVELLPAPIRDITAAGRELDRLESEGAYIDAQDWRRLFHRLLEQVGAMSNEMAENLFVPMFEQRDINRPDAEKIIAWLRGDDSNETYVLSLLATIIGEQRTYRIMAEQDRMQAFIDQGVM